MALFVDGPVSTIDDLTNQDSGFLEVAQNCGINGTTKLQLAHEEIASDLQLWLDRPRAASDFMFGPVLRLEQVVTTPALKRWETAMALAVFYRDAYFSELADRYQKRWDLYSKLSRDAYEKFLASGLGLVSNPVHKAGLPVLSAVAGPQRGGIFYACIAWVNAAGQEGSPSAAVSIAIADNNLMTISAPAAPAGAVGFNAYAGVSLDAMVAQNDVPLAPGSNYIFVPGFRMQGRLPGTGQTPDFVRPLARTLLRG